MDFFLILSLILRKYENLKHFIKKLWEHKGIYFLIYISICKATLFAK